MPAVKECISVHIGQAGCQVGFKSWELFTEEHGINPNGTRGDSFAEFDQEDDAYAGFFHETGSGQHVPRCIMVDTEPTVINDIRASKMRQLFHPESLLSYKKDCKNNFFVGREMARTFKIKDVVMDRIRLQMDLCNNPQGFFIFHSCGGGTGSGVGVEVLEDLRDTFGRGKCIFQPVIFPSRSYSSSIVEPYNCLFATHFTRDLVDLCLPLDNEAAYKICLDRLKIQTPDFDHVNSIIAQCISAATGPLRYETELNATLQEIRQNLVPCEPFKYPIMSLSPMRHAELRGLENFRTAEIVSELFDGKNLLCDVHKLTTNRYLAAVVMMRGDNAGEESHEGSAPAPSPSFSQASGALPRLTPISANAVIMAVNHLRHPPKNKGYNRAVKFVPWMDGSGVKIGIVKAKPVVPRGFHMASTLRQGLLLGNNTAVRQLFVRQYVRFLKLWFRKAYKWQFLEANNGEEDTFEEAKDGLRDLIDQYETLMQSVVQEENLSATGASTVQLRGDTGLGSSR